MQSKTGRMNANHELSVQRTHQLSEFSQDFSSVLEQNTHTVEPSMHLNLFDILYLTLDRSISVTPHIFLNFTIQEAANAAMSDTD